MPSKHAKLPAAREGAEEQDREVLASDRLRRKYLERMDEAIEACLLIESKYQPGASVPWKLNAPQKKLHKLWEDIRQFNLARSKKLHKLDPTVPISDGPIRIVCVKPRQGGISSYVQARFYLTAMWTPNYKVNVTAHQVKATTTVLAKARRYHADWRGPLDLRYQASAEGMAKLSFAHGSFLLAATAGSEDSERGGTLNAAHFSEAAYFPSWTGVSATLGGLVNDGTEVYESTGNGESGAFYEKWRMALPFDEVVRMFEENDEAKKARWNGFFRFFFAWYDDPGARKAITKSEGDYIKKTLTDAEVELIREHGVDLAQLAWRRDIIKTKCQKVAGFEPEEYFGQEWPASPSEAFVSRGSKFFRAKWLEGQRERAKNAEVLFSAMLSDNLPPVKASRGAANFRCYEKPDPLHQYVVAIDSAEGSGGDYTVVTIADRTYSTRRRVAMFRSRVLEPNAATDIAVALAEWYNNAHIINESTGAYGRAVSQRLIDNGYPNLYFTEKLGTVQNRTSPSPNGTFSVGYATSNQFTRGKLLSDLQMAVRDGTWEIVDPDAVEEYAAFEVIDGKAQAPEGEHDDIVIADALAVQFCNKLGVPDAEELARIRAAAPGARASREQPKLGEIIREKVRRDDMRNKRRLGKHWRPRSEASP